MVTVGLAQNFAALRALAIEGIQRGHMQLHAHNLSLSAGVPSELVEDSVHFMKSRGQLTAEAAREYLRAHDIYSTLRGRSAEEHHKISAKSPLSTFYAEVNVPRQGQKIGVHVAFEFRSARPLHLAI
jgi:hydroxymethylglutaryl-CoA synthase